MAKATISSLAKQVLHDPKGSVQLLEAVRAAAKGKPTTIELSNGEKVVVKC